MTKCGEGGYQTKSDVTTSKKYCFNNLIRMTQLNLFLDVAFQVDHRFREENMNILASMGPKICIEGQFIFSLNFVIFWGVTRGEVGGWVQQSNKEVGGSRRMMT